MTRDFLYADEPFNDGPYVISTLTRGWYYPLVLAFVKCTSHIQYVIENYVIAGFANQIMSIILMLQQ